MRGRKSRNNLTQLVPRGFLKSYILLLLRAGPLHGYKIMEKIKEKTKFWKPSPGSVYPALQSLVKKGFVKKIDEGRRKKYALTKKGLKISEEIKDFEKTMREKMSKILGEILGVDKAEIERFLEEMKKRYKANPLYERLNTIAELILKISEHPEKCLRALKILNEANSELKKLVIEV